MNLKTTLKIAVLASTALGFGCGGGGGGNGGNGDANDDVEDIELCPGSSRSTARQCTFLTVDVHMCPVDPLLRTGTRLADSTNEFRQCIDEGEPLAGGVFRTLGVDRFHTFAVEYVSNNQVRTTRFTAPLGDFNNNGIIDSIDCADHRFGVGSIRDSVDLGQFASSACQ